MKRPRWPTRSVAAPAGSRGSSAPCRKRHAPPARSACVKTRSTASASGSPPSRSRGEAASLLRDGLVQRRRIIELRRELKMDATYEREPWTHGRDLGGHEPAGHGQPDQTLPRPQPEYADVLDEFADKSPVACRGGMAPRRPEMAAAGERPGDPGVQQPLAHRILDREPIGAVLPDEWVQTPYGVVPVDRKQEAVERRQRTRPEAGRRSIPALRPRARHRSSRIPPDRRATRDPCFDNPRSSRTPT